MSATFSIGDLARATGVKPATIRWYEQEGWLPPPSRRVATAPMRRRTSGDWVSFAMRGNSASTVTQFVPCSI